MRGEKFKELNADFWEKFDFSDGKVIYSEIIIGEDMLQIEYPQNFLLDIGYYGDNKFRAMIIHDNNWQSPVSVYSCKNIDNLHKVTAVALQKIRNCLCMGEN
ncbi:MAG: hypothetical protein K2J08_01215 [Ruminococcus sp.]|nr:hypothetical protein [Ruminococcus sp.]